MIRLILALAAVLGLMAGCAVEPVPLEKREESAAAGHTCVGACDHIFVDGGWRVIAGHRHGPGCGHALVDGKWVESEGDPEPGKTPPPKDQ
jgi:hypothetical protein